MKIRKNVQIYANTTNKKCNAYIFDEYKKITIPWETFLYLCAYKDGKIQKLNIDKRIEAKLNTNLNELANLGIIDFDNNSEPHDDFYSNVFISNYPKPLENLEIEITNQCNLKCKHCFNKYLNKYYNLSVEKFEQIIVEGRKIGLQIVTITGGEPLLHNCFNEFVKILKKYKMPFILFSNGWNLDEKLINELSDSTLFKINISCDGHDSKSHDEFRGVSGSFSRVIKAANLLKKYKIPFEFSCVLHKKNIDNVKKMINLFNSFGVQYAFDFIIKEGNASKNYEDISISETEYAKTIVLNSSALKINKIDIFCGICINMLYISSNGDVKLCPSLSNEYVIGNVFQRGLETIWASSIYKHNDIHCEQANDCQYYDYCKGGCRSRALSLTGNINGIDKVTCELCKLKVKK